MSTPGTPAAPSISKPQAKRYALLATIAAATLAIVAELQRGNVPDPRIVVGAVIAAVLLTIGAEMAPAIAGGLAMVMLITALLVTGADVWKWAATLFSGARPAGVTGAGSGSALSGSGLAKNAGRSDRPKNPGAGFVTGDLTNR